MNALESQRDIAMRFKRLFDCADGQAVLEHLKLRFFHNATTLSFSASGADAYLTMFNEGSRFVVEYILGLYDQDIDKINKLIAEAAKSRKYESDDIGV